MTDRQINILGCFGIILGIPMIIYFMFWLVQTMPDYALGFGSCAALWASVAIIKRGGTK